MDAIAAEAGVAVQTVYFAFRTKPELLIAAYDQAVLAAWTPPPPTGRTGSSTSSQNRTPLTRSSVSSTG